MAECLKTCNWAEGAEGGQRYGFTAYDALLTLPYICTFLLFSFAGSRGIDRYRCHGHDKVVFAFCFDLFFYIFLYFIFIFLTVCRVAFNHCLYLLGCKHQGDESKVVFMLFLIFFRLQLKWLTHEMYIDISVYTDK